jgi:hypothetical protein
MLNRSRHRPHLHGLLVFRTDVPKLAEDGSDLFNYLTGYSEQEEYHEFLVAPLGLRDGIVRLIDGQAERARRGEPSRITSKMNALTDPRIIESLYKASQAGVRIDLIIRGICCLRPGLGGISENIRVVSLVGRFLEHARAFAFGEGEEEEIYLGSADLMQRNLDRRVEQLFPCARRDTARRFGTSWSSSWPTPPTPGSCGPTAPSSGSTRKRARNRSTAMLSCSKRGFSPGEPLPDPVYSCAYGSGLFQDASFPARGAFRQAVGGGRREGSRRGRVAARSYGP